MAIPSRLNPDPPKAVFVNCVVIDEQNRVGCAMYTSIPGPQVEPLWILVPLDAASAKDLASISITYKDGIITDVLIDRYSQSEIK